ADPGRYDWQGDRPLQRPFTDTLIYELHVGAFTRHPNSGVAAEKRGTYAGLLEKIRISRIWASLQWSCCRYFNSMPRTARRARRTTGGMRPFRSSHRIRHTVHAGMRSPPSTSFATW